MKKKFQKGFILLSFMISSLSWAQGHVEGGGDYLPIMFREAKGNAILILRTITPEILTQYGATSEEVNLYKKYREALAQDLEDIPPLIFCGEEERYQFFKPDSEKSALTDHRSGASIKINLKRCDELCITLEGAIVLLWREAGRHVLERHPNESEEEFMLRINPTLDSLEEIGVRAVQAYRALHFFQEK